MIGLLGRQGQAATLGQHCPQMTQRPGICFHWFAFHHVLVINDHDLILPGLVCRYAGEFVSEILAGIKTPERKKENDNAEEGKQRAR